MFMNAPAAQRPLIPAHTLRAITAISAAALFAFGVICWMAANWDVFHRLTKLSLVGALLLLAAITSILVPRARTPALLLALAAVGALLALIGQIYPSGADAWELFAYWTLFGLPFALAARHDAVWVLWVIVASVAIGLWREQTNVLMFAEYIDVVASDSLESGLNWRETIWTSCALAIALACVFAPIAPLRALTGAASWAFRLASLGAVFLVTYTGLEHMFTMDFNGFPFVSMLVLLVAAVALLRLRPLELGVLSLVFAGLDALLIGWIFRMFGASRIDDTGTILFASLLTAAIVIISVMLLRKIHARATPARDAAHKSEFSWPLAALSGFGALLAAMPLLLLLASIFGGMLERPANAAIIGALIFSGAIFSLRNSVSFGFRQMLGFIMSVVGFLLIGYAAFDAMEFDGGFILAAVIALAAWFTTVRWVRGLFGFAALVMLIVSVYAHGEFLWDADAALNMPAVISLIVAAGAVALLASRTGAFGQMRAFFFGWNVAGLVVLAQVAGRPFLVGGGSLLEELAPSSMAWGGNWAFAVSIALSLAGIGFLFWRRPDLRTPLGFTVAACMVALAFRSPALGAAIVIFAAALVTESRSLAIAAALAVAWIISAFYYDLAWTLVQKGYVLMGLGGVLGLVIFLTRTRGGAPLIAPRFASIATALIALGATATLGTAGAIVQGAEQVLRDGRVIYLPLRPVDPRSLMQGDYMALAFDTGDLPPPDMRFDHALALAELDERSVATLRELVAENAQAAQNQIVLKLRVKSGDWFAGSDAFFFAEGTGEDYEDAKFGQFRVGNDGRMLLVGLADQDLQSLPNPQKKTDAPPSGEE
ncbi:MAG: GDYXXLXY domain-containing protein [Gallionellaceae bacterium]|jgi:uncharacterized membrane-anchored protein/uncharacterized membrane protein|nr:GDYXXLXY domain-containing protein [Gallionellaceae bacterium]